MRHVHALGLTMILGAVLVGAALAVVMFQFEAASRAGQPAAAGAGAASAAPSTPATQAAPAPPTPGTTASGDAAAGAQVFARNCTSCHPNADAGVGPALHGAQFAAKYPDDAAIKQVIRNGGTVMPAFPASSLSDADLNAVVAYLRSLK